LPVSGNSKSVDHEPAGPGEDFVGKNFFRGIATGDNRVFGKVVVFDVLKGYKSNW